MSEKPRVIEHITEDYTTFSTASGKELCRIERDDDSYEAAVKVFEALNIEIVEEE